MTKIGSIYVEVRGDTTVFNKDMRDLRSFAKKSGTDVSNALNNAIDPGKASRAISSLSVNLSKLSQVAKTPGDNFRVTSNEISKSLQLVAGKVGMTAKEFSELNEKVLRARAWETASRSMRSIARSAGLSSREVRKLAISMGFSSKEADRMASSIYRADRSSKSFLATASTLHLKMLAVGAAVAGGVYAFERSSKALYDAGMQYQRTTIALGQIMGGAKAAAKEIEYLREVSDRYGQNLYDIIPYYKSFAAATLKSGLDLEETRTIFEGATKAAASLGLTSDDTGKILYSLQQMVSKGMRGIAEEVNQQLGERLPGAFALFAKSLDVSEKKLRDMMEQGELTLQDLVTFGSYMGTEFSGEIAPAVEAQNKFNQAWMDLKVEMSNSGFLDSATKAMQDFTKTLKDPEVIEGLKAIATGMGKILELSAKVSTVFGQMMKSPAERLNEASDLFKKGALNVKSWEEFRQMDYSQQLALITEGKKRAGLMDNPVFAEDSSILPTTKSKSSESGDQPSEVETWIRDESITKKLDGWFNELEKIENKLKAVDVGFINLDKKNLTGKESRMSSIDQGALEQAKEWVENRKSALEESASDWKAAHEKMYADTRRMSDLTDLEIYRWGRTLSDTAKETADSFENAFDGWAVSYASTLNDMLWASEATFGNIARSFGKMVTQMVIQDSVKSVTDSFSFSGLFGGVKKVFGFHGGGVPGEGEHSFVRQLPAFHTGVGPDEVLSVIRKDEGVFTPGQMKALGSAVSSPPSVSLVIKNETGTPVEARQDGQPKWDGREFFLGVVLEETRKRGAFQKAMKAELQR